MDQTTFTATRLSLHVVAELLLAGPQYDASGSIALGATPRGFGCTAQPDVRVEGTDLVVGSRVVALDGRTVGEVATDAGLVPRPLDDLYGDGPGLGPEHPLSVEAESAAAIAEAFRAGEEALAALAPDARRVLWPEHFDLGITLDEVNYGVSPGDGFLPVPYAYVGPWTVPDGEFWNASFGAARPLAEVADLLAFFAEGRDRAVSDRED
ncbi:MAG: hypothetical protein J7518_04860 [Nocardioidaceae bacterium]|nr:hypothetical protein [Nocardioidaceae bacterium]